MNKEQVKLTDRSVHSIGSSLREFGYATLTDDEVRNAADRLLAGEEPTGNDVIEMFVARMLREAGLLPDES
jgi:hypothetical protein